MARDVWWWWRKALAGGEIGGTELPVHADVPQPGFYRIKSRAWNNQFIPCAIWWRGELDEDGQPSGDEKLVAVKGFDAEKADPCAIWTFCCRNPISKHAYDEAVRTGGWADVDKAIADTLAPPPMGHNAPDEVEVLKDQITSVLDAAKEYAVITDETMAARAQGLRVRANELAREADKKREVEKRPHFEASKAVDAKWQPLIKSIKDGGIKIGQAISAYLTAEAKAAAQARREAENAARAAMAAASKEQAASQLAQDPKPEPKPEPTVIRGGYGKAASVKVVRVIVNVISWDALWNHLKAEPLVKEVMLSVAQKLVNNGQTVPGVEIEEQRKVA